jgi:hypothetical protein
MTVVINLRDAAQQALESIEDGETGHAAQTLREALAAPQPRREVELTDEEIQKLAHVYDNTAPWTLMGFARAVIEAYRDKQGETK